MTMNQVIPANLIDLPKPKVWLISDTHYNHGNIATYCDRPKDFTYRIVKNCKQIIKPNDLVIHLGDVFIGNLKDYDHIWQNLPGRWILIRGNHDRKHSISWWMEHGFQFACDSMIFRAMWLTHEPANSLPEGCAYNIHGHLHNIWDGFHPNGSIEQADEEQMRLRKELKHPWQRLFAIEYTNYMPVDFDKFVSHPDKYLARGIRK